MKYKIQQTSWQKNHQELSKIRHEVFIMEQHVPEELEWDKFDHTCMHFFVIDNNNTPIACARLKQDGHIGRMAVIKKFRKIGIGSALLNKLIETSQQKNILSLYLHAQIPAINFYQQHGFEICSEKFMDAGIPHKTMKKNLSPVIKN